MLAKGPAWAVSNVESVRREAARYRGVKPEKKLEWVASACRTAALLLASSPNRGRALGYAGPLPPSSVQALARLIREEKDPGTAR